MNMPAPMRVVSLLPSATETLCAIGGEALLVGRSHECDFPASITDRPVLTRQRTTATSSAAIDDQVRAFIGRGEPLYELDTLRLGELRPDVILTQDLCEVCSIDVGTVRRAAARMRPAPHVVTLNPATLEEVFDDLLHVGEAVELTAAAEAVLVGLRERYYSALDHVNPYAHGPEVAFLEWMDPPFVAGHWTPGLIEAAGGRHSLNPPGALSRRVEPQELLDARPEHIVICPCGYDLAAIEREFDALAAQPWWGEIPAVRAGRVALVDGNQMFNRPGPRLVDAACWLVGWLLDRPEIIPEGFPARLPAGPRASQAPG